MARSSDSTALLVLPLSPDLTFALSDAVRFFLSRHRTPRRAGISLLGALQRVLEDLPPGRGTARLSLTASQGTLRVRLGLSRVRLSGSLLRRLLRDSHPLLEVTSHPSGAGLSFCVRTAGKH